jgi:hypothetical protein
MPVEADQGWSDSVSALACAEILEGVLRKPKQHIIHAVFVDAQAVLAPGHEVDEATPRLPSALPPIIGSQFRKLEGDIA